MAKEEKEGKKKSKLKIVLIALVVIVVVAAIGGMGGGSGEAKSSSGSGGQEAAQSKEQKPAEQEPYTITDEQVDGSNQFAVKITGTLTNNTDKDKTYIQVEYNLYDADGAQIGTALANTNNLKAGGTWKYEATGTAKPENVASWERVDVDGF